MLRIILLIVISYIVIRIALRLLLTESPMQRRTRGQGPGGPKVGSQNNYPFTRGGPGPSRMRRPGSGSFDDIEDAEFEEIPPRKTGDSRKEE